jgi:hypothetical protein
MRFAFVEEHSTCVPVARLCRLLQVTSRGFRAWRNRPVSNRQRYDMELLALIREQHHLSLGSYGRPRMTQELALPPTKSRYQNRTRGLWFRFEQMKAHHHSSAD